MRAVGVVAMCAVPVLLVAAGAAGQTQVGASVLIGTTIMPPPAIDLGTAAPGGRVDVPGLRVDWLSNDTGMDVLVRASSLRCGGCGPGGADASIAPGAVRVSSAADAGALDRPRILGHIAWLTGSAHEIATFDLSLTLPVVEPGTYRGVLDFLVLDPADAAAGPRVALDSSGDPRIVTAVQVTVEGSLSGAPSHRGAAESGVAGY